MVFYFYILILLVSVIALGVASGFVARALFRLSRVVGVNEYVVAFMLLGVATSLPEIFIAMASILAQTPTISVGNVLGANFVCVTLALGITALLSDGLTISRGVSPRVFWLSFIIALLPAFMVLGRGIDRLDGLLLWGMFLAFLVVFARDEEMLEKTTAHVPYGAHYFSEIWPDFWKFVLGLLTMIFASVFIVLFTSRLAYETSMDAILFSTIFLGLASALPELFFGVRGALLRHPAFSLGNILASVVFNSTVIIGSLAIFSPTVVAVETDMPIFLNAIYLFFAFILLSIFSYTGRRIDRLEGILLSCLYLLFLVTNLLFFIS